MKPITRTFLAISAGLLTACSHLPGDGTEITEDEIATMGEELYGDVNTGSDCTADENAFLEDVMQYGRIAVATDAFVECVDQAVRTGVAGNGPYRECTGDPFLGQPVNTQIARVMDVARSTYDVSMNCTGGSGNASTSLGTWNNDAESFSWGGWFRSVHSQLDDPLCSSNGNVQPCRFAAAPWPFSQAAGIAWHEVMHRHAYNHGANDQANAKTNCGYAGQTDAFFNFQVNTMPYIIGNCVSAVINRSGNVCGNMETCGRNELKIVDGFDGTTCACEHDPRMEGLGVLNVEGEEFHSLEQVATDEWMGSWNYGSGDRVLGAGDFDGDGKDEYLIQSGWGLGVIGMASNGRMRLQRAVQTGNWIGSWHYDSTNNKVEGVGDFNGDGRADFIIRSPWGIGIVGLTSTSYFVLHSARQYNGYLGSYYLRSDDSVHGVGDFDGNGKDEMLITNRYGGLGIVGLGTTTFASLNVVYRGNWIDQWNFNATDATFPGIGDVDDDGKDEFVIQSGWGLGIIERKDNGTLGVVDMVQYGTLLSRLWSGRAAWRLTSADSVKAVLDLNGDGRDDIVLRNTSALGVLSVDSAGTLRSRTQYSLGTMLSGGWRLGSADNFVGVGNFDGYRGEDLVVRSGWGSGVLSFRNNNYTLVALDLGPFGDLLDTWLHAAADKVVATGDLDGDGTTEFLLQRP